MKGYVSISDLVALGYGSRDTILEHIHTGDFIARNPGGGKWIINLESYEEWLEQRTRRHRRRYKLRRKA